MDVIDKAFEKLDPNVDDSETDDDDESYRVDPILEAKVTGATFSQSVGFYILEISQFQFLCK